MKILILGSEGFVGNNLVDGLSENHDIFCADMISNSHHKNYHQFDVTNSKSVMETIKDVDVVIDLVAHSLVSSIDGPSKNAEVNILGLLNILEACKNNDIKKLIFTSASSLVGEPQNPQVTEDHICTPKTAYGITKLTSEHYLRLYSELHGINYTVFRFFNIYGPHQKNGLIPSLFQKISSNEPLTVQLSGLIEGCQKAISLMKRGDKWKVFIDPAMAYGDEGRPGIPPNSILIFEIELLEIQ